MNTIIALLALVAVASAGLTIQTVPVVHSVPVVHAAPVVHHVPTIVHAAPIVHTVPVQRVVVAQPVVHKVKYVPVAKSSVFSFRAPSAKIAVVHSPVVHHGAVLVH